MLINKFTRCMFTELSYPDADKFGVSCEAPEVSERMSESCDGLLMMWKVDEQVVVVVRRHEGHVGNGWSMAWEVIS